MAPLTLCGPFACLHPGALSSFTPSWIITAMGSLAIVFLAFIPAIVFSVYVIIDDKRNPH